MSLFLVSVLVFAPAASPCVDGASPCVDGEGDELAALRQEALKLYESGQIGRALPLLEEFLSRKQDDVEIIQTIGYIRYRAEDFGPARASFEALLEVDGNSQYALFMLGNVALQEFRLGDSLCHYRALSSLNRAYPHLEGNVDLLEERIGRVRTLKGLRERCDLFYYASLAGGVILLLLLAFLEFRT